MKRISGIGIILFLFFSVLFFLQNKSALAFKCSAFSSSYCQNEYSKFASDSGPVYSYCSATNTPATTCPCPDTNEHINCHEGTYNISCYWYDPDTGESGSWDGTCTAIIDSSYDNGSKCSCCGDGACNSPEDDNNCPADCCSTTSPDAPTAVSPLGINTYTEKTDTVTVRWTAVSGWGEECSGSGSRGYDVCVGPLQSDPCNGGVQKFVSGASSTSTTVSGLGTAINYWKVRAKNEAGETSSWSSPEGFCYYGSDPDDPLALSAWGVCSAATHHRTRSCIGFCDCTGLNMDEVCQGVVKGTLFDASYIDVCPGDTNGDGYINENIADEYLLKGVSFNMDDQAGTVPVPDDGWSSTHFTVSTLGDANYGSVVYAPATYTYDFSPMAGLVDTLSGPRLTCTSAVATVPGNATTCLTKNQPCSVVNNVSFGFWKIFGGWWQVVGGSVYGATGIHSYIPPTLTSGPKRLILPDANLRYGFLSYGTLYAEQLGSDTNARVSDVLWEIQSLYRGLRYDYNFYRTRMDVFASTVWDGGDFTYSDGGKGYQILKHTGNVTLSGKTLTTEKVILLVDGSVTVTGDLVTPGGAFLGVIANGNITFNPGVSQAQGWFVAENINVPCKDSAPSDGTCDEDGELQFLGEGSFVGWNNINLSRDRGLANNQAPSEKFTYRPDFLLNAPAPMKVYTRKFTPFVP